MADPALLKESPAEYDERPAARTTAHTLSALARGSRAASTVAPMSVTESLPMIDPPVIGELALPAVDQATLQLAQAVCDNRLVRRAQDFGIDLSGVTVTPASEACGRDAYDPALLELSFSEPGGATERARALVGIDLADHPALLIAIGPGDPVADAPASRTREALTNAVAGLLLDRVVTRLRDFGLADARLVSLKRGRIADACSGPVVNIVFSVPDEKQAAPRRVQHAVWLPPAALRCIDSILALAPPVAAFLELPVPGRVIVGIKPLAVAALQQLQAGDVLLRALFPSFDARFLAPHEAREEHVTQSPRPPAPRAIAVWGTPGLARLSVAVELTGRSLVIVKEPHMSENLDSAYADAGLATDQADDPIRIGELELPVQFEIDTVAMPLAQLSSLGPGYVVELPVPFAGARLRLVAHGRTIGYGELVTVGDHLGVRIIQMAHNQGSRPRTGHGSIQ
ncbi:type III secretion protein Q [Burkholderia sp. D7]|nr:type III secretion protein Q [Burkholderia sp. D7]